MNQALSIGVPLQHFSAAIISAFQHLDKEGDVDDIQTSLAQGNYRMQSSMFAVLRLCHANNNHLPPPPPPPWSQTEIAP